MNTLKITKEDVSGRGIIKSKFAKRFPESNYTSYLLFGLLLLLWPLLQHLLMGSDPTVGYVDPNIWLLILLSLICFLLVTGLCWWLLQQFWMSLGLPALGSMVLQFKELTLWQRIGFYWASFGLLLLAAVGVLTAIL
jgi:hypothetical protein